MGGWVGGRGLSALEMAPFRCSATHFLRAWEVRACVHVQAPSPITGGFISSC